MKTAPLWCCSALLLVALAASAQQLPKERTNRTKVVLLGTGQPVPDPDRSGPATAIVVDENAYLVDFGPGVMRRAKAAVLDRRIAALEPANLMVAFATHLHSDHTVGYPDLIFTGWTVRPPCTARSVRSHGTQIDDGSYFAGMADRY